MGPKELFDCGAANCLATRCTRLAAALVRGVVLGGTVAAAFGALLASSVARVFTALTDGSVCVGRRSVVLTSTPLRGGVEVGCGKHCKCNCNNGDAGLHVMFPLQEKSTRQD